MASTCKVIIIIGFYLILLHWASANNVVGQDDNVVTDVERQINIDVLANDYSLLGKPIHISGITDAGGAVSIASDEGRLIFSPLPAHPDPYLFSYEISDGQGSLDSAQVNVCRSGYCLIPRSGPAQPINFFAVGAAQPQAQIQLSWTDVAIDEDGFRLYRAPPGFSCPGTDCPLLVDLPADTNTYTDTNGIQLDQSYQYVLESYNTQGVSPSAGPVSVTVSSIPPSVPLNTLLSDAFSASGSVPLDGQMIEVGGVVWHADTSLVKTNNVLTHTEQSSSSAGIHHAAFVDFDAAGASGDVFEIEGMVNVRDSNFVALAFTNFNGDVFTHGRLWMLLKQNGQFVVHGFRASQVIAAVTPASHGYPFDAQGLNHIRLRYDRVSNQVSAWVNDWLVVDRAVYPGIGPADMIDKAAVYMITQATGASAQRHQVDNLIVRSGSPGTDGHLNLTLGGPSGPTIGDGQTINLTAQPGETLNLSFTALNSHRDESLSVTDLRLLGTHWSIQPPGLPGVLSPLSKTPLALNFSAPTAGRYTAQLEIESSDASEPVLSVNLVVDVVSAAIVITQNPEPLVVASSEQAVFTCQATGGQPSVGGYHWRWFRNGSELLDPTAQWTPQGVSSTLTLTPAGFSGLIQCEARDGQVSTMSSPAPLVVVHTQIVSQPQSLSLFAGETGSFTVTATTTPGSAVLEYQWEYYNGSNWAPISDASAHYEGTETAILQVENADPSIAGDYRVVVSNEHSVISSTANLSVLDATAGVPIVDDFNRGTRASVLHNNLTEVGDVSWSVISLRHDGTVVNDHLRIHHSNGAVQGSYPGSTSDRWTSVAEVPTVDQGFAPDIPMILETDVTIVAMNRVDLRFTSQTTSLDAVVAASTVDPLVQLQLSITKHSGGTYRAHVVRVGEHLGSTPLVSNFPLQHVSLSEFNRLHLEYDPLAQTVTAKVNCHVLASCEVIADRIPWGWSEAPQLNFASVRLWQSLNTDHNLLGRFSLTTGPGPGTPTISLAPYNPNDADTDIWLSAWNPNDPGSMTLLCDAQRGINYQWLDGETMQPLQDGGSPWAGRYYQGTTEPILTIVSNALGSNRSYHCQVANSSGVALSEATGVRVRLGHQEEFFEDFSTGDVSKWNRKVDWAGQLTVQSIGGDYRAVVDNSGQTAGAYLVHNMARTERIRSYFIINADRLPDQRIFQFDVWVARNTLNQQAVRLQLRKRQVGGEYHNEVRMIALEDDHRTWRRTSWQRLFSGDQRIRVDWWTDSVQGEAEGGIALRLASNPAVVIMGVNNSAQQLHQVFLGMRKAPSSGLHGQLELDNVEIWY